MGRVVIVGGGPAGAALSWLLASRGLEVTLVERASRLDRQFRGEALMPSGRAALAAMGLEGLLAELPGRALDGWRFILDRRELFTHPEPQPGCWLVSQPALLQALIHRAQQHPGMRWRPGCSASPLRRGDGRVMGVQLDDGQQLGADLVVAADGRHSSWRAAAGLPLVERPGGLGLLWFRLPSHPSFEAQNLFTTVLTGRQLFSVVLGAADGLLQLAWVVPPGQQPAALELRSSEAWAHLLADHAPGWLAEHLLRHAEALSTPLVVEAPMALARLWHQPGLLLLGDAVHPMSPVRAQGINMALRDAVVAANHLVPLLRQGARASPSTNDTTNDTTNDIAIEAKIDAAGEAAIDAALASIQAEREGEIRTIQGLQAAEACRGQGLRRLPLISSVLGRAAPLVGPLIAEHWWGQQQQLREGCAPLELRV